MSITNRARAHRAKKSLKHYKRRHLKEGGSPCEDTLTDFLTDAMHLYPTSQIAACLHAAKLNYLAEATEPRA
jgi:hypothetical protein